MINAAILELQIERAHLLNKLESDQNEKTMLQLGKIEFDIYKEKRLLLAKVHNDLGG